MHQRGLLPPARDDDPGGGARALRGRWVVLQHVWQSVGRLQRQSDGAVPVRCLPDALPRPIRSARPGGGGCRLSRVHGRFIARGCRRDCRTDPSQAPERGVSDLHQGSHRRHHVGVEYGGRPGAAAVAVLGERQRQPGARIRARKDPDQPGDELRRLSMALCSRAPAGTTAAPVPEHGATAALPPLPWSAR